MKKAFISLICCLLFTNCVENNTNTQHYKNSEDIFNNEHVTKTYSGHTICEFQYKNHEYIFIKCGDSNWAFGGMVHNPDCKCQINNKEK